MYPNQYRLADFQAGDTVKAFHPRMFGVVCHGTVALVGRKWLHVDFGTIRGGTFKIVAADVVELWQGPR
jgi:hypothetical protein